MGCCVKKKFKKGVLESFGNFTGKAPVLDSLFNEVAGLMA